MLCRNCLEDLPRSLHVYPPDTFILFSYRDVRVKKLLRDAKYNHHEKLYKPLVEYFIQKQDLESPLLREAVLVPVPTHPLRVLFRGQNHTKTLAHYFSKQMGLTMDSSLLLKKKLTKRQALLTRKERLSQQYNSFIVSEKKKKFLSGKTIILVDDIMTTGSTLEEARKTLLEAGTKEVYCLALAH